MASFSHIERRCHQHYSCCWYFLDLQLKREEAGDMRRPPNQQLNLTEVGGGVQEYQMLKPVQDICLG